MALRDSQKPASQNLNGAALRTSAAHTGAAHTGAQHTRTKDAHPPDEADVHQMMLFQGLAGEELNELNTHLHLKHFSAGAPILSMEQRAGVVYFIHRGTIKILSEDQAGTRAILSIVGPGDVLGEISALDGMGHSANAIALEPCTLWWMDRTTFHAFRKRFPVITENLLLVLARRTRLLSTRLHVLATGDVPGRLATQLLAFALEYGHVQPDGTIYVPLRLTQNDLGALVGASRQHINTILTGFRRRHILSFDAQHRITVHNKETLAHRVPKLSQQRV